MAPIPDGHGAARGVVAEGPVGSGLVRRFRLFRYEVRCWRNGTIPDLDEAVGDPQWLTDDLAVARRMLELVREVPTYVWGRDDLRCRDMWNSNSLVSWLIVRSGLDVVSVQLPAGGRAPGWAAGIAAASDPSASAGAAARPRRRR